MPNQTSNYSVDQNLTKLNLNNSRILRIFPEFYELFANFFRIFLWCRTERRIFFGLFFALLQDCDLWSGSMLSKPDQTGNRTGKNRTRSPFWFGSFRRSLLLLDWSKSVRPAGLTEKTLNHSKEKPSSIQFHFCFRFRAKSTVKKQITKKKKKRRRFWQCWTH